jgi:DNA ligase-1
MVKSLMKETLYALTKTGKVKVWSVEVKKVDKDTAIVEMTSQNGIDAKEVVRQDKITEGKNIGRANETNPATQALLEAQSRINEKLQQGYTSKIPKANATHNLNALGFLQPMLAHPIDKVKDIKFPCHIQPKLDGHRALVTKDSNGNLVMFSRKGIKIDTMGHILKEIKGLKKGDYLDGELYVHGKKLQDIASLIKKYRPRESEKVKYHVYDMITPGEFGDRYDELKKVLSVSKFKRESITIVSTGYMYSMEAALVFADACIDEGYEGAILRPGGSEYEPGVRSRNLIKIKKFDDSEHLIIDVQPGATVDIQGTTYTPAIFVCQTPTGKTFEVMSHGTYPEKCKILKAKNKYTNKYITIKHSGYTKDGIPWHPVALRLREDI